MEKQSSGTENAQLPPQPPKKLTLEKVVSQLAGYDASKLVGGIVEKSVSAIPPSSAPRSSVLPFPVARHRSHAPHWVPKAGEFSGSDGNEDEDFVDIDNDTTDYDPIAKFAKSVKKEKKKGLDLSNWRDLVPSNDASKVRRKEVEKKKVHGGAAKDAYAKNMSNGVEPDKKRDIQSLINGSGESCVTRSDDSDGRSIYVPASSQSNTRNSGGSGERSTTDTNVVNKGFQPIEGPTMLEKEVPTSFSPSIGPEQDCLSLEAQIDAENQARLQSMSPDELAEAQAEIKDKINPKLLEVLRNRSRKKSEKQTSSHLGSVTGDGSGLADMQVDKSLIQDGNNSSNLGHKHPAVPPTIQKKPEGEAFPSSSRLWDAWSKRVEAARDLRFSLEGDIVESDFLHSSENSLTLYGAGNATERDPLRTEGDPAAAGYTIKEALALARSVVPGQRAIALHLLACVFRKVSHGICQNQFGCSLRKDRNMKSLVDWEAIWAYALGPEPELALSLRMLLDDNHKFVVLASAKVIQCILGSDANENYFDVTQKMAVNMKDLYTAPVFRSRPKINLGCLRGGFWKYSAKPSSIIPFTEDKTEEEQTIKDDIAVASQDIAAGLVRMETLSRLYYLLETQSTLALDECILSILIAIARHSPTCANAILKCHGLVQLIVDKFASGDQLEIMTFKIRSVTLLRVLAQSSKKSCFEFTKNGIFQKMTWHLLRVTYSIDDWTRSGGEHFKLSAALMIEQLRFLKVCISYGYCISSFFFPALCLWLDPPSYEKLMEKNALHEYTSVSKEVYLILDVLARRLPSLYAEHMKHQLPDACDDNAETWCWKDVAPMVDLGLKWLALKSDSPLSRFLDKQGGTQSQSDEEHRYLSSLLWVTSAILHMLSTVIVKATPEDRHDLHDCGEFGKMLLDLVTKIGLQIIKNDLLCFDAAKPAEYPRGTSEAISFIRKLCSFRHHTDFETSLASVCCLHGVIRLLVSVDRLFQMAKSVTEHSTRQSRCLSGEAKILDDGIANSSMGEWRGVLFEFMSLVVSEWRLVQKVEIFGRGGPAPGVELGWGVSGGGFWCPAVALAQADATLLVSLLEMFQTWHAKDLSGPEDENCSMQLINSALIVCLIAGPSDRMIVEKAWTILLQLPVLRYLNQCIHNWLRHTQDGKVFQWQYEQNDLVRFSNILASHFSKRWLVPKKKKSKAKDSNNSPGFRASKGNKPLETIHEDMDTSTVTSDDHTALTVEWAHQRLPLPDHWFLSPITSIADEKGAAPAICGRADLEEDSVEFLEVASAGLFFLFGIEAMASNFLEKDHNPILNVPLVWKLHSLSVLLLGGMGILDEDRSKDAYEALQSLYGLRLDELRSNENSSVDRSPSQIESGEYKKPTKNLLGFQSEIHESYSTFIEALVEQFAAVSYGNFAYGRQIAIYLHQQVEIPVRLAAWTVLSNARVLDLLPPLDECIAEADGYFEPVEEHDGILEAYVKSWVTGALDRAATRGSIAYTIVLHHLSSFIFSSSCGEKLPLRNKLVKSLLRDCTRKHQREGMMLNLVWYKYTSKVQRADQFEDLPLQTDELNERLELLRDACGGISSLLSEVEKLKASFARS